MWKSERRKFIPAHELQDTDATLSEHTEAGRDCQSNAIEVFHRIQAARAYFIVDHRRKKCCAAFCSVVQAAATSGRVVAIDCVLCVHHSRVWHCVSARSLN